MVRRLARFCAPAVLSLLGSRALYAQVLSAPVPGQQVGGSAPVMLFNPASNNPVNIAGPGIGRMRSNLPTLGQTPGVLLPPGVSFTKGVGVMPTLPQTLIPVENSAPFLRELPQFEEYSIKPALEENAGNRKDLPPTAGPSGTSRALTVKGEALRKPLSSAADLSGATGEAAEGLGRKVIDLMMDGFGGASRDSNLRPDADLGAGNRFSTAKEGRLAGYAGRSAEERSDAAVPGFFNAARKGTAVSDDVEYRSKASRRAVMGRVGASPTEVEDPITLAGGVALIVMEVSRGRLSLSHVRPRAWVQYPSGMERSFSEAQEDVSAAYAARIASKHEDYSSMTLQAFSRAGRTTDETAGRALVEDLTLQTLPAVKTGFASPKAEFRAGRSYEIPQNGLSTAAKYGFPLLLWSFFPLLSLAVQRPQR